MKLQVVLKNMNKLNYLGRVVIIMILELWPEGRFWESFKTKWGDIKMSNELWVKLKLDDKILNIMPNDWLSYILILADGFWKLSQINMCMMGGRGHCRHNNYLKKLTFLSEVVAEIFWTYLLTKYIPVLCLW